MPSRTTWQKKADVLWPDDWDMVDAAYGTGRWATVSWCGALTVHLHLTRKAAEAALRQINYAACGHRCERDHELVDLNAPQTTEMPRERLRKRLQHFRTCHTCQYVFSGRAPAAAMRRATAGAQVH